MKTKRKTITAVTIEHGRIVQRRKVEVGCLPEVRPINDPGVWQLVGEETATLAYRESEARVKIRKLIGRKLTKEDMVKRIK